MPGAGAIEVRYVLSLPEDEDWYAFYDVLTAGEQGSRVTLTVPVDEPVTVYNWVWDGDRLLESGDEADDLSYTLYEAPEEEEGLLEFVTSWILDPEADAFAAECPDAEPLEDTKQIAGRNAIGFGCHGDDAPTSIWVDSETDLLLSLIDIPEVGEGGELGTLIAERVRPDVPIESQTFSTDPPAGADVEVVEATGVPATPTEEEETSSVAELEAELREIAASTPVVSAIYYLGPEFGGQQLTDLIIFNDRSGGEAEGDNSLDPGQSLVLAYGEAVQMSTTPFRPPTTPTQQGVNGCRA